MKFDLCYYGQVNSLLLISSVALKWASKHLWDNIYFAGDGSWFSLCFVTIEALEITPQTCFDGGGAWQVMQFGWPDQDVNFVLNITETLKGSHDWFIRKEGHN